MRSRTVIAIMLLVFALVIFIAFRGSRQPWVSLVHFQFVGFQATTNGQFDAVYYVTNWPREDTTWVPQAVSYRNSSGWQTESNFAPSLNLLIQNQTNIEVRFLVPDTNVPMRTVTKLTSGPAGWKKSLTEVLRALGVRSPMFRGQVRWITNEITSADPAFETAGTKASQGDSRER